MENDCFGASLEQVQRPFEGRCPISCSSSVPSELPKDYLLHVEISYIYI